MSTSTVLLRWSFALGAAAALASATHALTPAELLAEYSAKAGTAASPERGQRFFNTRFSQAFGWSCASCHGAVPTQPGADDLTKKVIGPMAPAFNPVRFTDRAKAEHQFRLNCKDVVGRECSATEKANVLAWLLTLKP
jgi:mono/diheme cytochrome c family protein